MRMPGLKHGGTNLAAGLGIASDLLGESHPAFDRWLGQEQGGTLLRVIAYSDGHDQNGRAGRRLANRLKNQGVLVETFGIAPSPSQVGERFLRRVATTDEAGCHYRFLGDADTVRDAFEQAAEGTLIFEE